MTGDEYQALTLAIDIAVAVLIFAAYFMRRRGR